MVFSLSQAALRLILAQIGVSDADERKELEELADVVIAQRQAEAERHTELLRLYVKLDLLDVRIAAAAGKVDNRQGDEESSDNQITLQLHRLRDTIMDEIETLETSVSGLTAAAGMLTATTPRAAPLTGPDPSDPYYRGDALLRRPQR